MSHFPASASILSAAHLGQYLQGAYGLDTNTKCTLIKAGINHTYAVAGDTGKYVFRVYSYNWRTEKDIAEEIRLVKHLRDANMAVSYALPDALGKYIQQFAAIEGTRYGVLFSFAVGEKMHNFPQELHFNIGKAMASIHKYTEGFKLDRVNYTPEVLLIDSFKQLASYIDEGCEEMKFMAATRQYLLSELKKADTTKLRQGALHLDMWFDNLVINTQGEPEIFDFDFCGNGWLCYDVAYYIMQTFVTEPDSNDYAKKGASFLQGYESITKLTAEEKRLLPLLGTTLYFFYLGVQCERFENWSNVFINETYLKRFITVRVKKYFEFAMQAA